MKIARGLATALMLVVTAIGTASSAAATSWGYYTVTWGSGRASNVWNIQPQCTGWPPTPETCRADSAQVTESPEPNDNGFGTGFDDANASLVNGQWTMTVSAFVECGIPATFHYSWDDATLAGSAASDGKVCGSPVSDTFTLIKQP